MNNDISKEEEKILHSVLLFIRTIKPYEVAEIKLQDNRPGRIAVHVKTNNREVFDI